MAYKSASIALTGSSANDSVVDHYFQLVVFLRTHGWTVDFSSDGTTGGAGDNISVLADLNDQDSYVVLGSPDGLRQILFYRTNTAGTTWGCRYSHDASYSGGTASTLPTATNDYEKHSATTAMTGSVANVLQITADDAAPYGFFTFVHLSGVPTDAQGGYCFNPMILAQANDTDPYTFVWTSTVGFTEGELSDESTALTVGGGHATTPGAHNTSNRCSAASYAMSTGGNQTYAPNRVPPNDDNKDILIPICWGRRSDLSAPQMHKGFSQFLSWNGVTRAPTELFISDTRVSIGDCNAPWEAAVTLSVVG